MRLQLCLVLMIGCGLTLASPSWGQTRAADAVTSSAPGPTLTTRRSAKSSIEWMQAPQKGRVTHAAPGPVDEKAARLEEGRRKFFDSVSGFEPTSRWDGVPSVFDGNGMPSAGVRF